VPRAAYCSCRQKRFCITQTSGHTKPTPTDFDQTTARWATSRLHRCQKNTTSWQLQCSVNGTL